MIINFAFGLGHGDRLVGTVPNKTRFGFNSEGLALPPAMAPLNVVNTHALQLPVDVVIAGQQPDQKKATPLTGIPNWARGIFGE